MTGRSNGLRVEIHPDALRFGVRYRPLGASGGRRHGEPESMRAANKTTRNAPSPFAPPRGGMPQGLLPVLGALVHAFSTRDDRLHPLPAETPAPREGERCVTISSTRMRPDPRSPKAGSWSVRRGSQARVTKIPVWWISFTFSSAHLREPRKASTPCPSSSGRRTRAQGRLCARWGHSAAALRVTGGGPGEVLARRVHGDGCAEAPGRPAASPEGLARDHGPPPARSAERGRRSPWSPLRRAGGALGAPHQSKLDRKSVV